MPFAFSSLPSKQSKREKNSSTITTDSTINTQQTGLNSWMIDPGMINSQLSQQLLFSKIIFEQHKNQYVTILQNLRMNLQTRCKSLFPLLIKNSKIAPMPTFYQSKSNLSKISTYFASFVLQSKSSLHDCDVGWLASHFSALNFSQHMAGDCFSKRMIWDKSKGRGTKRMAKSATVQKMTRILMNFTSSPNS